MRILLALLILLPMLIGGRYAVKELKRPPRAENGPMEIAARPLVLDSSRPERTQLGSLHFLGAWDLTGPDNSFGGLSAMSILPDGRIQALNDTATMFTFPSPGERGAGTVKRLPILKHRTRGWLPGSTDSESMAVDPATGTIWVGFELSQMICRYPADLSRAEACRTWPEMKDWTDTSSIESLARLPDGRFLVIAEGAHGDGKGRDMLLFADDPSDKKALPPILMHYMPPVGYDPTDAVAIGGNRLLVLNRRATVYDGFTAVITLVDIGAMKPGAVLPGKEVARLAPPVLADNFEAMTVQRRPDGQTVLWVLSDNNHLFFQRTLLLKFALPDQF
ncbi:MAG: esterase-like activity of phytase family protein [Sphingobium sp.]